MTTTTTPDGIETATYSVELYDVDGGIEIYARDTNHTVDIVISRDDAIQLMARLAHLIATTA